MSKYKTLEEMREATKDLTPAQIIDALYCREPDEFGDEFANDSVGAISYTRLTKCVTDITAMLVHCVRADALKDGRDVDKEVEQIAEIISETAHGVASGIVAKRG